MSEQEPRPPFDPTRSIEFELSDRSVAELNHVVAEVDQDPDTVVNWLLQNCASQALVTLD